MTDDAPLTHQGCLSESEDVVSIYPNEKECTSCAIPKPYNYD